MEALFGGSVADLKEKYPSGPDQLDSIAENLASQVFMGRGHIINSCTASRRQPHAG